MEYPLFGIGLQGKSPNVTAQIHQNLYFEFQPAGDRTSVAVYGTPGLETFVNLGANPTRGMLPVNDLIYIVNQGVFYEINSAGTVTARGMLLTGGGLVSMAYNGTQVMIVDGIYGYIYTVGSMTFVEITDGDFPENPGTVTYQDTYFVVSQSTTGRFYISASGDGLSWDALDFASAEGSPDNLIRVVSDHGEIVLFGGSSIEFFGNSGAQDFPYVRVQAANLEWGLAAKNSVAKFDNSLVFLAKNTLGEVVVTRMNGYQPQRISNFELEYLINSYSVVSDAVAFAYMLGGHPMYQINFPTAEKSWLYDGATNLWSPVTYGVDGRHRAQCYAFFAGMRLVSDYENGNIYKLDSNVYSDNGVAIRRVLRGRHVTQDDKWLAIDRLQLVMETGVGLSIGQGDFPQAMLRWSRDGGHTWSNEVFSTIGKIGEYDARCMWSRLGRSRDWTFEIAFSDPVKIAIVGANITLRPGIN